MLLAVGAAGAVYAQEQGSSKPPSAASESAEESGGVKRRVPCPDVLSEANHDVTRDPRRRVDLSRIAKRLNTSTLWVEHCMIIYGRRARRPGIESAESREQRLENWEENEPEEAAAEDTEERGEREEKEPVEKQLRIPPPRQPTPGVYEGY